MAIASHISPDNYTTKNTKSDWHKSIVHFISAWHIDNEPENAWDTWQCKYAGIVIYIWVFWFELQKT